MIRLLIICLTIQLSAQTSYQKVDQLVENRKYSDAVKLLVEMDPNDTDPEAFRRKINICIEHYTSNISHRMFALKNFEPGEKEEDFQGKDGVYDMYLLNVAEKAENLMAQFPDNFKLKFAVAKYYYSMHINCGDCTIPTENCIENFEKLFTECYEHNLFDAQSLYAIGYAKLNHEAYQESIPYFLQSIELDETYPTSHYNLAYAYLYLDDREKSIAAAAKALDLYDDPTYKADAAKMIATAYMELKEFEKAYSYYKQANTIHPGDYYILNPLLNLSLYLKKPEMETIRNSFFELDSDNPTIYQDLIQMYRDQDQLEMLQNYFKDLINKDSYDLATKGNLYFFIGQIYLLGNNNEEGKASFIKAREILQKVLPEDHQVFSVIEELLKKE